jgi:transcriptional regulator with XRE-family HTH domain
MSLVLTYAASSGILRSVSYFYAEFGAKLKLAREKAGLTQKELAERVKLPRTSVTNIEHGRQRIALHQLVQLASALGTEPMELLPDEELNLDELVPEKTRSTLPEDDMQRQFLAGFLRDNRAVSKARSGGKR